MICKITYSGSIPLGTSAYIIYVFDSRYILGFESVDISNLKKNKRVVVDILYNRTQRDEVANTDEASKME